MFELVLLPAAEGTVLSNLVGWKFCGDQKICPRRRSEGKPSLYVGDAHVGKRVNVGANYVQLRWFSKASDHPRRSAFIGSNSAGCTVRIGRARL